jgi:hypothetical protein
MAVSGGRLYIGGTFKTANGVARSALAAVDPVTGALSNDVNLAFTGPRNGTVNIDKFDIGSPRLCHHYRQPLHRRLRGRPPDGLPPPCSAPAVDGQSWQSRGLFVL